MNARSGRVLRNLAILGFAGIGVVASSMAATAASIAPVGTEAEVEDLPDLAPELLLQMDVHLIQADFIGSAKLESLTQVDFGRYHGARLVFDVLDTWTSRWPATSKLNILITDLNDYGDVFRVGSTHVLLLSGGPWRISPFTHREHSVFRVDDDGTVRCASGNPLFGVTNQGFVCSTADYQAGSPLALSTMKTTLLSARGKAAARSPDLASRLDTIKRPLRLTPTRERDIERTALENSGGLR